MAQPPSQRRAMVDYSSTNRFAAIVDEPAHDDDPTIIPQSDPQDPPKSFEPHSGTPVLFPNYVDEQDEPSVRQIDTHLFPKSLSKKEAKRLQQKGVMIPGRKGYPPISAPV